jgi:hypothetical protein
LLFLKYSRRRHEPPAPGARPESPATLSESGPISFCIGLRVSSGAVGGVSGFGTAPVPVEDRGGAVRKLTAFRKRAPSPAASAGAPSDSPRIRSSSQSASALAKSCRT